VLLRVYTHDEYNVYRVGGRNIIAIAIIDISITNVFSYICNDYSQVIIICLKNQRMCTFTVSIIENGNHEHYY